MHISIQIKKRKNERVVKSVEDCVQREAVIKPCVVVITTVYSL